jgi:hypothetical protein
MSEEILCPRCKDSVTPGRANLLTAAAGMGGVIAAGGAYVVGGHGLAAQVFAALPGIVAFSSWVAALARYHCAGCGEILSEEFADEVRLRIAKKRKLWFVVASASTILMAIVWVVLAMGRR